MEGPESRPFVIREAHSSDAPVLLEIDRVCFAAGIAYTGDEIRWFLAHPASIGKVAESDGRILGFAIGMAGRTAHVITLDVIPEARGRRIGSVLLEALHEEFRRRGIRRVSLEVATDNISAQRLYERFGYRQKVKVTAYYQDGSDAYRMLLIL